jgi:flagellar protein FliO/FliZ
MDSNELVWAVVRISVALPLVLFLAFLVIKYGLARRYAHGGDAGSRLQLLEQLPLSSKTALSLVALGDKYYLLAHQDNTIQLIKELDHLPVMEKSVTGDVIEFIPRSVLELDQDGGKKESALPETQGTRPANHHILAAASERSKGVLATGMSLWDKLRKK